MVIKRITRVDACAMLYLIGSVGVVYGVDIRVILEDGLPGDSVDVLQVFCKGIFHFLPSFPDCHLPGTPFLVFFLRFLSLCYPLPPFYVFYAVTAEIVIQLFFRFERGLRVLFTQLLLRLPDYLFRYLVRSVHNHLRSG